MKSSLLSPLSENARLNLFFFFFEQHYCPIGISPMGNSGCFPQGKPAVTHYQPTGRAECFTISILHPGLA